MRFFKDRKLDNNRVDIDAELVRLSYVNEDELIKEENVHFNKRSGFCLDRSDGDSSVSIDNIGEIELTRRSESDAKNPRWSMFCYPDEIEQAREKFKEPIQQYYERKLSSLEKLKNALNL